MIKVLFDILISAAGCFIGVLFFVGCVFIFDCIREWKEKKKRLENIKNSFWD